MSTYNGVDGEWVVDPDPWGDHSEGIWRLTGDQTVYVDGRYEDRAVRSQWEQFVPTKPKNADLPEGSIVPLPQTGGGIYVKTYKGWKYISVFSGTIEDVNGVDEYGIAEDTEPLRIGKGDNS